MYTAAAIKSTNVMTNATGQPKVRGGEERLGSGIGSRMSGWRTASLVALHCIKAPPHPGRAVRQRARGARRP